MGELPENSHLTTMTFDSVVFERAKDGENLLSKFEVFYSLIFGSETAA